MSKKNKFIFTTIWILFSRSYDAYCTFQLTPDLSKESNPLVSWLGMTWTPLLITISLLTIYVIYVYARSVFYPTNLIPAEKGYSFSNIIAFVYLGYKDEWTALFYKFPKNLQRFNRYMGYFMPPCLVFAGIVSTLMWLLINYSSFYKNYHSVSLIYTFLIGGCVLIIYQWNRLLYQKYLREEV